MHTLIKRGLKVQVAGVSALALTILGIASVSCSSNAQNTSQTTAYHTQLTVTSLPVFPSAPGVVFAGEYCKSQSDGESRLEQLARLSIGSDGSSSAGTFQNNVPKSVGELLELGNNVVKVSNQQSIGLGISVQSLGLNLGGGYVLTTNHGVTTQIEIPGVKASFGLTSGNITISYYLGEMSENSAIFHKVPAQSVTVLAGQDLALVYAPSVVASDFYNTYNAAVPPFRTSNSLKSGEIVYVIARRESGLTVLEGPVASLAGGANYSNQFNISIETVDGDSGSPVFDRNGNLLGLLSGGDSNISSVATVDGLEALLSAEKAELSACPK